MIILLLAAAVLLSSMIVIYFGCIFRRYKVVEHKNISGSSYFKICKKDFFSYKPFRIPVKVMAKNDCKEAGLYYFYGEKDIHRALTLIDKVFYSRDDALRACAHCVHGKIKYKGYDIFPVISFGEEDKELFALSIYSILMNTTYVCVGTEDSCKNCIDNHIEADSIASRYLNFRKETVVKLGLKQRIKDLISK